MAARKTAKKTAKQLAAPPPRRRAGPPPQIAKAELEALIEEAVVDACDDEERRMGFFTMLEDNIAVPFETEVLAVPVKVTAIVLNNAQEIVAVCSRGQHRQRIPLVDLPLPSLPPEGFAWIEAYRLFASRGG